MSDIKLPPMPEWAKMDNLDCMAPFEIRTALNEFAREAVRLNAQAVPSVASSDMVATERKRCESLARQALEAGMSGNWARAEMLMTDIKLGNYYTHIQLHPIATLSAAPAAPQPAQPLTEKDALLRRALEALVTATSEEGFEQHELNDASLLVKAIRNHLGVKND